MFLYLCFNNNRIYWNSWVFIFKNSNKEVLITIDCSYILKMPGNVFKNVEMTEILTIFADDSGLFLQKCA